jgi:hypothetical protein
MCHEFKEKISRRAFASIVICFGMAALLGSGMVTAVMGQTNPDSNKMSLNNRTSVTARAVLERELDLGLGPEGLIAKCPRSGGGGRSVGGGLFSAANAMNQLTTAWQGAVAAQNAHFNQVEQEAERLLNEPSTDVQSSTRTISKPSQSGPKISAQSSSGGGNKKTSSNATPQPPPVSTSESLLANSQGMPKMDNYGSKLQQDPAANTDRFGSKLEQGPMPPPEPPTKFEQGYKKNLAQDPSPEEPTGTYVTENPDPFGSPVIETPMTYHQAVATKNLEDAKNKFGYAFVPAEGKIPEKILKIGKAIRDEDYETAVTEALTHALDYVPGVSDLGDLKDASESGLGQAMDDYRKAFSK